MRSPIQRQGTRLRAAFWLAKWHQSPSHLDEKQDRFPFHPSPSKFCWSFWRYVPQSQTWRERTLTKFFYQSFNHQTLDQIGPETVTDHHRSTALQQPYRSVIWHTTMQMKSWLMLIKFEWKFIAWRQHNTQIIWTLAAWWRHKHNSCMSWSTETRTPHCQVWLQLICQLNYLHLFYVSPRMDKQE